MAMDVRCNVCGRTFEHEGAGPTVRCPYCQMTVKVPQDEGRRSPAGSSAASETSADNWYVYTCDAERFGPITKEELDRWAAESRLTASCQVYQEGWPAWRTARELYPHLTPAAAGGFDAAPNVGGASAAGSQNPYAAPTYSGGGSLGTSAYQLPHRGAMILAFGILGWFVCFPLAIPAWVMGHGDLEKMRAGAMDPSGYGMTMAGMVLGIVQCVLLLVSLLLAAVVIAILAALA
jgi:hypothetical protein